MSIPESAIVKVSLSVSQQATSQSGFGLTCLFGTSNYLPVAQRFGLFSSLTDVGAVFPANSPEYQAAATFFSTNAAGTVPSQLMIARMFNAAVAAQFIGGATQTTIATLAAIANGSLSINIDGTAEVLAGINLTGAGTFAAVAAILQTAIDAVKAGVTVSYNGTSFIINSGTTGVNSTLAFATPAPAGTDLAPLLGLLQTNGGVIANGSAAETVTQSLQNVLTLNPFYLFSFANSPSDADLEAAAAFALATGLISGYTTTEPGCVIAGTTTDIGSVMKASTNKRVIGIYDQLTKNPFAIMSAFSVAAQVDFAGSDTSETLMFKQLPGVSVSPLSTTQKAVLDSKNLNYYINVGGNPMFATGVMADGSWFDQVQGLDWLMGAIQDAAFQGLYGAKKVSQDDRGMATLLHLLEVPMDQGVTNGLLAPGVWNGQNIGQIKTGDVLTKGYYMFAASVNSQSQVVRNTRVAPPITIIAKGAGAIQGVNILVNFEQ
jgi:hypothetical protein